MRILLLLFLFIVSCNTPRLQHKTPWNLPTIVEKRVFNIPQDKWSVMWMERDIRKLLVSEEEEWWVGTDVPGKKVLLRIEWK